MGRAQGRVAALVACVGVVVASSGCGSPADPALAAPTDVAGQASCLRLDAHLTPRWQGGSTMSAEAAAVGEELHAIAAAHPDEATGTAVCSDGSGSEIHLSPARGDARTQAEALALRHPGLVHVAEVPHSLTEQLVAMDALAHLQSTEPRLHGWGPREFTGGLLLMVTPTRSTAEDISLQRGDDVAQVRAKVAAAVGADYPLVFEPAGSNAVDQ